MRILQHVDGSQRRLEQLMTLLNRLVAEQRLAEGVHPGAADPRER
jgi:hypothetical protein